VNSAILTGAFHQNLLRLRALYREQHDALCDQLIKEFTRLHELGLLNDQQYQTVSSFVQPQGGYFIWITLPNDISEDLKAESLYTHAEKAPYFIRFRSGPLCSQLPKLNNPHEYSFRLCFAYYNCSQLREFALKLGALLEDVIRETK
jgi:DNA-binding transcriptional MocR family regulator